jgi:hypothetical protein
MSDTKEEYPFLQRANESGVLGLAPLLPIRLGVVKNVEALGLLDTGAALSVLPYSLGVELGAVWEQQTLSLRLSGAFARVEAKAVLVRVVVGAFEPVSLGFAWAKTDAVPLLLGQVNFFAEFDVCFSRSREVFEVRRKMGEG